MPKPLYQAVEIASHQPVGGARNSIQFARSDAGRHQLETGQHCFVVKIEVVWSTMGEVVSETAI